MDASTAQMSVAALLGATAVGFGKVAGEDLYKAVKATISWPFRSKPMEDEAARRATDTMARIQERLQELEVEQKIDKEILGRAMSEPGVGLLLHSALIQSAETSSEANHDLLARMVVARLQSESESLLALTLPFACSVIPRLRSNHFAALAIHAAFRFGAPIFSEAAAVSAEQFKKECDERFEAMLSYYKNEVITSHDISHLASLGCGDAPALVIAGNEGMLSWYAGGNALTSEMAEELPFFINLKEMWRGTVMLFKPTACGEVIGLAALEVASKMNPGVKSWCNWIERDQHRPNFFEVG